MSKTKSRQELDTLASDINSKTVLISKKVVFECPFSYMMHEKTEYQGVAKDMYIFKKPSLGGAFIIAEQEGKILLICQFRSSSKEISYEVPAGNVDTKEEPVDTARRELLEETGYDAAEMVAVGTCFVAPGFSDVKCYYFLAKKLSLSNKNHEPTETILDQDFFTLDEVNAMILDGRINDGPTVTAIHYYTLYKNKNG